MLETIGLPFLMKVVANQLSCLPFGSSNGRWKWPNSGFVHQEKPDHLDQASESKRSANRAIKTDGVQLQRTLS